MKENTGSLNFVSLQTTPGGQPESEERYVFHKTVRQLIKLLSVHLEGKFVHRLMWTKF